VASKNDVVINIIAETKKAVAGFAKLTAGIGLAVLGARKLVRAGSDMVMAFAEQEEAQAKLASAIRATGRTQEINQGQIEKLASSLQKVTTFGDEVTISATAMLQQLANLNQEGLEEIIPSMQDFAAAMGLDLNTAATLVGKTLGSSTNALTRYGIEVDTTASAQDKLNQVIEAMNEKFEGTAVALGETTLGSIGKFQSALGDLQEIGGAFLADVLIPLVKKMTEFATILADARGASIGIAETISDDLLDFGDLVGAERGEEALRRMEEVREGIVRIQKQIDESSDEVLKTILKGTIGLAREKLSELEAVAGSVGASFGRTADAIAAEAAALAASRAAPALEFGAGVSAEFFPTPEPTEIERLQTAIDTLAGFRTTLGEDFPQSLQDIIDKLSGLRDAEEGLARLERIAKLPPLPPMMDFPIPVFLDLTPKMTLGISDLQLALFAMSEEASHAAAVAGNELLPALEFIPPVTIDLTRKMTIGISDLQLALFAMSEEASHAAAVAGNELLPAMLSISPVVEAAASKLPILTGLLVTNQQGFLDAGTAAIGYAFELQDLADDAEDLATVTMASLTDSIENLASSAALDAIHELGRAFFSSSRDADDFAMSIAGIAQSILDALPQLMFSAGINLLATNPELGALLIVGSGIASFLGGLFEGATEPAVSATGASDNPYSAGGRGFRGSGSQAVVVVNNYNLGSILRERDAVAAISNSASADNRGF